MKQFHLRVTVCEWGEHLQPDSHGNHPFLRNLRDVIAEPSTLVPTLMKCVSYNVLTRIESVQRMQIMNSRRFVTCAAVS